MSFNLFGVIYVFALSVRSSVRLSVRPVVISETTHPVFLKFGIMFYDHKTRKVADLDF